MNDLLDRLLALSRHEHSDYTIGDEAADEITRLRAQIAAHERECAGKWVKERDRLPKPNEAVAAVDGAGVTSCFYDKVLGWCFDGTRYTNSGVTHWLEARLPGEEL